MQSLYPNLEEDDHDGECSDEDIEDDYENYKWLMNAVGMFWPKNGEQDDEEKRLMVVLPPPSLLPHHRRNKW